MAAEYRKRHTDRYCLCGGLNIFSNPHRYCSDVTSEAVSTDNQYVTKNNLLHVALPIEKIHFGNARKCWHEWLPLYDW